MWALDLWKHDCLAHSHREFCRRLWPALGWHMGAHPAWWARASGGVLEPEVPAGIRHRGCTGCPAPLQTWLYSVGAAPPCGCIRRCTRVPGMTLSFERVRIWVRVSGQA